MSNEIIQAAIDKCQLPPHTFFSKCATMLHLENPEVVATRLTEEYDAFVPVDHDVPQVLDLAFQIAIGRLIV
jgi:hypothetical protein